jgi:hypothetical protein
LLELESVVVILKITSLRSRWRRSHQDERTLNYKERNADKLDFFHKS